MSVITRRRRGNGIVVRELRDNAIARQFADRVGHRAFILTFPFPFLYIGEIEKVEGDILYLCVESSHLAEIEGLVARIHVIDIDVFYIEEASGPRIPSLKDDHLFDHDEE